MSNSEETPEREQLKQVAQVLESPEFQESLARGIDDFNNGRGKLYQTGERPISGERKEGE